jgi:hypothetical protein
VQLAAVPISIFPVINHHYHYRHRKRCVERLFSSENLHCTLKVYLKEQPCRALIASL